jgi:hypothetical protein
MRQERHNECYYRPWKDDEDDLSQLCSNNEETKDPRMLVSVPETIKLRKSK